ncbi:MULTISPECIES: bifunctional adenosylcobinamide kinase/adenosylcobinamide-phosphate guanylyltransferase [unclassified Marichromatium]|uniref:bifunctional adenosylcobinamide kinase/adenosylcobinamide-phosphate guanylyltransferase n=1 Tax=unclassified Marichromatium TaxID=2618417 RepID=UPI000F40E1DD|nr:MULTISPECIES: bifunctional adenosylcobinamide kinase/adenosylcobinamide-phosphate guanylyltransferase [unclassified Marichromatium]RNE89010.1 bifunctional adenosylcobinamide kinase/adenosylcobinamide-phosphate guanylyltransferase [Marichromatium sp. AB31]RNE91150.1 bifunctional adenosylcobinamide kinase/adenosylcobinamide-phosphate guanylyltransferase [Marichromatium sp. AB32]
MPEMRPDHRIEPRTGAILVTGPARSGKSEWAERLARDSGLTVVYVATAALDPEDAEWCARIEAHRVRRPPEWLTCEAPTALVAALAEHDRTGHCLLVDSLGTWVANWLEAAEAEWAIEVERLLEQLGRTRAPVILVAEETGWGVIPAHPQGRLFRDRLGALTRRLGPRCAASYLVSAGHAIDLSRLGIPID